MGDLLAREKQAAESTAQVFEDNCAMCHGPEGEFPIRARGRSASEFYDLLARLPEINDAMPPYDGSDAERQALAEYLTTLGREAGGGAR
jgi:mono/diheme cytochrome c family protein